MEIHTEKVIVKCKKVSVLDYGLIPDGSASQTQLVQFDTIQSTALRNAEGPSEHLPSGVQVEMRGF